jgi:hypothetical protein
LGGPSRPSVLSVETAHIIMSPNRLYSYQHCPEDETLNEGIEIGVHGGQSTSSSFELSNPRKKDRPQLLLIFVATLSVGIGWFASGGRFSTMKHQDNDLDETNGDDKDMDRIPDLIWSDEFDGDQVDMTKWTFVNGNGCDVGLCGWGEFGQMCFGIARDGERNVIA